MSGRAVCCFIPDQQDPNSQCRSLADYEIGAEGGDGESYTHACAEHMEQMLTDAPRHCLERIYHMPAGVLWDDPELGFRYGKIGDWYFVNNDSEIMLRHPDPSDKERGTIVNLPLYKEGEPKLREPAWLWDGNREAPTLSPSIRTFDNEGDRWHGYLKAGKLENA